MICHKIVELVLFSHILGWGYIQKKFFPLITYYQISLFSEKLITKFCLIHLYIPSST